MNWQKAKNLFKDKKLKCSYASHKTWYGKTWHFLAHDDSTASFIVDALLVIIIGRYILYPLIGLALGSSFPIVAVVSGSMDHDGKIFGEWWDSNGAKYDAYNITDRHFERYDFASGFEKGDVLVVKGFAPRDLRVGDVIVYATSERTEPIIHRVISKEFIGGAYVFETLGDANSGQLGFEKKVTSKQIAGKAVFLIPKIGWVKVGLVDLWHSIAS